MHMSKNETKPLSFNSHGNQLCEDQGPLDRAETTKQLEEKSDKTSQAGGPDPHVINGRLIAKNTRIILDKWNLRKSELLHKRRTVNQMK